MDICLFIQQICMNFEWINKWIDLKLEMEERKPECIVIIIKAAEQFKNHYKQEKLMKTLYPCMKGRIWYYFSAAAFQKPNAP